MPLFLQIMPPLLASFISLGLEDPDKLYCCSGESIGNQLTCHDTRLDKFSTMRRYSVRVGGPYLLGSSKKILDRTLAESTCCLMIFLTMYLSPCVVTVIATTHYDRNKPLSNSNQWMNSQNNWTVSYLLERQCSRLQLGRYLWNLLIRSTRRSSSTTITTAATSAAASAAPTSSTSIPGHSSGTLDNHSTILNEQPYSTHIVTKNYIMWKLIFIESYLSPSKSFPFSS